MTKRTFDKIAGGLNEALQVAGAAPRLTPAQRKALLWLPVDGRWQKFGPPGGFFVMAELEKAGLARIAELGFALTPAGIAARKELEKAGDAS